FRSSAGEMPDSSSMMAPSLSASNSYSTTSPSFTGSAAGKTQRPPSQVPPASEHASSCSSGWHIVGSQHRLEPSHTSAPSFRRSPQRPTSAAAPTSIEYRMSAAYLAHLASLRSSVPPSTSSPPPVARPSRNWPHPG